MRAVNLIPTDARRGGGGGASSKPGYAVLAVLAGAVILITIYVLTNNTIAARKARLATVQAQAVQEQAHAAKLAKYVQFEKLSAQRAETVRQIATTQFDWHAAMSDLSKVVPPNTSLQSLLATVAPGINISGAGGSTGGSAASTGSLRAAIAAPAFELRGCTASQDDVARLMSRLRLMNGVTRVTLADSAKQNTSQGASPVNKTASGASGASCPANSPTFDVVVFFRPLAGAPSTQGPTPSGSGALPATAGASATTSSSSAPNTPASTAPGATAPGATTSGATTTTGGKP